MLYDATGGGHFSLHAASEGELLDAKLEKTDCQVTCLLSFAGTALVQKAGVVAGRAPGLPVCLGLGRDRAPQPAGGRFSGVQHMACLVLLKL